jgi:hypothetical protein
MIAIPNCNTRSCACASSSARSGLEEEEISFLFPEFAFFGGGGGGFGFCSSTTPSYVSGGLGGGSPFTAPAASRGSVLRLEPWH